jgi:hypothetical protein
MAQGVKNYCLDSKKKGQIRNEFDPSGMWWCMVYHSGTFYSHSIMLASTRA